MGGSTERMDEPLYNSRILRNYARLIAERYSHINLDELLEYAGIEPYQLEDEGHWFTQKQSNRFHEKLRSLTNENIAREAGKYTASTGSLGILRQNILSLMGLPGVFENMGKWTQKLSRASTYESRMLSPNRAEMIVTPKEGTREEPFQCQNRLGYIEGVFSLFNVKPPQIDHPECMFRNGSVCRYLITWAENKFARLLKIRNILFLLMPLVCLLSPLVISIQETLAYVVPSAIFVCLAMGWYTDKARLQEFEQAMEEIRASSEEQMEQISKEYDNSLLINEVGQILNREEKIEGVLQAIIGVMQKRLSFDRGLILMANRSGTKLLFQCGYGYTAEQEDFLRQADFILKDADAHCVFAQAFNGKKVQSISDAAELVSEQSSQIHSYIRRMNPRSIICCPIIYESEVLGVLAVDATDRKKRIYQREINLIMGIASQIGARVHNISLHERLQQTQKMEAVGKLAGGVAHDFNNILTTILGYSEFTLLRLPENDPLKASLEEIHSAGERASRLTRQLLAFSRKQKMEMKVVNLNNIVTDITRMLKRLIGDAVEIKLELTESLDNILADVSQLEQILLNLAVNARDALPSGGQVSIKTDRVTVLEEEEHPKMIIPAGTYSVLTVSDTGEGMSEAVRERIFDPFFTTKEVDRGTGMGLSTVYGIVRQHNGYINVKSEVGKGSSFIVYFPAVDSGVEESKSVEKIEPLKGTATILAVDDDPAIRKLVFDTLEPLGYTVLVAAGGMEAIEICRSQKEKIDLLLTDVVMPGMNGKQLISTLQSEQPDLKAIMMSGYPDDIITPEIPFPKATFISKPFTPSTLTHKIIRVLENNTSQKESSR